jgi:hypothetical protein
MQAGYRERTFGHVDARDGSGRCRHGFSEDAATTADINDFAARQFRMLPNPVEA